MLRNHPRFAEDLDEQTPDEIQDGSDEEQAEWRFQQEAILPDVVRGDSRDRRSHHRSKWHCINLPHLRRESDEDDAVSPPDDHQGEHSTRFHASWQPPLAQVSRGLEFISKNLRSPKGILSKTCRHGSYLKHSKHDGGYPFATKTRSNYGLLYTTKEQTIQYPEMELQKFGHHEIAPLKRVRPNSMQEEVREST